MRNLKSLKEFGNEQNHLTSSQMEKVTGGKTVTSYEPGTCNGGCTDHTIIKQQFTWNGSAYIAAGPPYSAGVLNGSGNC